MKRPILLLTLALLSLSLPACKTTELQTASDVLNAAATVAKAQADANAQTGK